MAISTLILLLLAPPAPAAERASPIFYAGTEAPCVEPAGWLKEYRFKPNCSGEGKAGSHSAPMSFNSRGLRDRDYTPVPAKNTYRVLLMGASNVLGIGLPESATLARQLEQRLAGGLKRKVEVINGAINGYCTWQSAFLLRELVRAYKPDLVLFNVGHPSCYLPDTAWEGRVVWSESGDPLGIDRSLLGKDTRLGFLNDLYFRPRWFFQLHTANDTLRKVWATWRARLAGKGEAEKRIAAATGRALAWMRKASGEEGAFFAVFLHDTSEPVINQYVPYVMNAGLARFLVKLQPELRVSERQMHRDLAATGIPMLWLRDFVFETHPDDGHISADGTRRWAEALGRALLASFDFKRGPVEATVFRQKFEY